MQRTIRIGTRESQLAVWQATLVKDLLAQQNFPAELIFIKSEGDIDLKTPLYEMGVQGIFTKSLDIALLNHTIDIAVHSMKDVPTQLAKGIAQAAVLKRASYKDLLVYKNEETISGLLNSPLGDGGTIATSSIRRKAQWLHRYPNHQFENLRGNVNTRLKKLNESNGKDATALSKQNIAAQEQTIFSGFVAQEVEQAAKDAKYNFSGVDKPKNETDMYGLRYAEFVVPLVKAVQELSKKNEEQQNKLTDQQQQINELREIVNKLVNDKK